MNQQETIERLTTLKNILSRLPDGLDEKRASLKIVQEFLAEATRPQGFQKTGNAEQIATVLGQQAKVKATVHEDDSGSVTVGKVSIQKIESLPIEDDDILVKEIE